jgi:hypothetical protein
MAGVLAHNVIRELQMMAKPPERGTTANYQIVS